MAKKIHKKPMRKKQEAAPSRRPLFALPHCPHCGRTVPYRTLVARLPLHMRQCRCGEKFSLHIGAGAAVLWLLTLLCCFGLVLLVMSVSTDLIPAFFFTAVLVAGAFFLTPFTFRAGEKNAKQNPNEKNGGLGPVKK